VLAAALACVADLIVTFDTKDFPLNVLRPFGVTAVEPDDFVLAFVETGIVDAAAAEHRASLNRPPLSPDEYLGALHRNRLPKTAAVLSTLQI
jgi:hypothetical protein